MAKPNNIFNAICLMLASCNLLNLIDEIDLRSQYTLTRFSWWEVLILPTQSIILTNWVEMQKKKNLQKTTTIFIEKNGIDIFYSTWMWRFGLRLRLELVFYIWIRGCSGNYPCCIGIKDTTIWEPKVGVFFKIENSYLLTVGLVLL